MATTIQVTCPICGDQKIGVPDIFITISDDATTYTFTCPVCAQDIEKPADQEVVDLLLPAGVQVRRAGTPDFSEADIDSFADWLHSTRLTVDDIWSD